MVNDADLSPLILLVDDAEDNRTFCTEFLRASGLRVCHADDGEQAFLMTVTHGPDLVVMVEMPILDGWEAIRLIKSHAKAKDIPMIAITNDSLEGHRRCAYEAGADAVLTKQGEPGALLSVIRQLLARTGKSSP
jgi:CheY-like chemotaxis protein